MSHCVQCGQNSSNEATSNFKWTEVRSRDYKSSLQSYLSQEVQTCQFGMFPYWTHWMNYGCPSGRCCTKSTVGVNRIMCRYSGAAAAVVVSSRYSGAAAVVLVSSPLIQAVMMKQLKLLVVLILLNLQGIFNKQSSHAHKY